MICPSVGVLEEELKTKVGWEPPMGRVEKVTVVRSRDEEIRKQATDGGAVTAILTHLIEKGAIDGAAVTKQLGPFRRQPWLAMDRKEIIESAGSDFDLSRSGSITLYTPDYTTYAPSVRSLGPMMEKGLANVALVGTPCQIKTVRKMETIGVMPSQSIYCLLGLFCSGSYVFGDKRRETIERIGSFSWSDVKKLNIKDDLIVRLNTDEVIHIPLEELDFVKRTACRFCDDYSAEYADLSFGGIGAEDGWTTVVARTSRGMEILNEALDTELEEYDGAQEPEYAESIQAYVEFHSTRKKENAASYQESKAATAEAD
jgi:coenzyme F420 hydrogenase subunit beta